MPKPINNITDESGDELLLCLVKEFTEKYGRATHRLHEYKFLLTDRMGCAKKLGLNYSTYGVDENDTRINVNRSDYVEAVKALCVSDSRQTPLLRQGENPLYFSLTEAGYKRGLYLLDKENANCIQKIEMWLRKYSGIIAAIAAVSAIVGGVLAVFNLFN